MQVSTTKKNVLTGLIIVTLCFIWGNSLMPGTISSAISDWVGSILSKILGSAVDTSAGHGVLRKLAHGTEYLILGLELTVMLRLWKRRPWSLVILSGLSAALIDETIQLFVAGRSSQIRDVWIDLGGFLTGIVLCILISKIHKQQKK